MEANMRSIHLTLAMVLVLIVGVACSNRTNTVSYGDSVKKALEQADLKDITVTEDRDKNTITLGGKVHSENAKQQAGEIAQAAAANRIVANEISIQPVGEESAARNIASNVDDAIEKNYKAALISKGLDKQSIRFNSKNGVITLKGHVKSPQEKQQAQEVATNIPNVQQVLNELEVRR
jgi:hyperosmotically inducible periplasmic protein